MNWSRELLRQFFIEAFKVGIRAGLMGLGTVLINKGLVTGAGWTTFMLGAATVLGTLVYSLLEKYKVIKFIDDLMKQNDTDAQQ